MDAGSEGRNDKKANQGRAEETPKRPKRQMKTPFQLEELEKTYAVESHPCEATRAGLSEKLGLTDRQLQMWFCHRRLKDKKEAVDVVAMKPHPTVSAGRKGLNKSPKELVMAEPQSRPTHASVSSSDLGSGSSRSDTGNDTPVAPTRYHETPWTIIKHRAIACVEAQLGEPLREDGPILGMEFDELPPCAFGAPILPVTEQPDRYRSSYGSKVNGQYNMKHMKASSMGPLEAENFQIRVNASLQAPSAAYINHSPLDGAIAKSSSLLYGNGFLPQEHVEDQVKSMDLYSQPIGQVQFASSQRNADFITHIEHPRIERKRKNSDVQIGCEAQVHEKKFRKELEKQDLLKRKREEHMRKEMERQERERQKEEQRIMREQQRQEEKFQREERREMERREKLMQKELLRAERMKQKEDLRREKEAARQKALAERATARKIAKESMELIEDERLEMMELAAFSKGLASFVSLDHDTLQNLDVFRESLCQFPPKSVQLKRPFGVQPWIDSEENVGNLVMVWKFCVTFADVLGLWPFTLDEFVQSLHDYDSRLLGEIHIALLKLIIKDIEDVVRSPSGGPGTNQYNAVNLEGGHPRVVEGAYLWGFDIQNWQKHLNPLTWPEILRQLALSTGLGPQLEKKCIDRVSPNDKDKSKGCEEIVSTLRNGLAAENAVAIMQQKGLSLQHKSRHRLTPGTVKFAAYHVLALEGSEGLNVIELAEKIQRSGLRDLTTSKTPEASISVALSRDPTLFERIAPSTYCVRTPFRKDPADTDSVIAAAKEKIQRYAHGILAGQTADEGRDDDDSDSDVAEASELDVLATSMITNINGEQYEAGSCLGDSKEKLPGDVASQTGLHSTDIGEGNHDQGVEIDEGQSGELWVQGLTEEEYCNLSVEERLNAFVALIGIANEGNSIRLILEDRMDAANALKKQMWADAQLDKRRIREEFSMKFGDSSFNTVAEYGLGPLETKLHDPSAITSGKNEASSVADVNNSIDHSAHNALTGDSIPSTQQCGLVTERSRMQLKSFMGHKAEELHEYRSLPLGQDRRRNRYWYCIASASCLDPGSGRIFVETANGSWKLIDSEEAFHALLTSLDTRGTRESHLHIMLQKIEIRFKECIRRNCLLNNLNQNQNKGSQDTVEVSSGHTENIRSAVCSSISGACVPSLSFKIDVIGNGMEKTNFLKRYGEFQNWMWKECFDLSVLHATAYGKKRCLPLLEICEYCLASYDTEQGICTSSHRHPSQVDVVGNSYEKFNCENNLVDRMDVNLSDKLPVRISLIKALLTLIEVSVPCEAIHAFWTDYRKIWGIELQNCSSAEALLQFIIQFEGAIKRDYLSADFETAAELSRHCDSSRSEPTHVGSVLQLPWIPCTTAAVALRLLELDASIYYSADMKAESRDEKILEAPPKFSSRYGHKKDIQKVGSVEFDRYGSIKEENQDHPPDGHGSSGYWQVIRRQGGIRSRGRLQKFVKKSNSRCSRQTMKQEKKTVNKFLLQRGVGTIVQKLGRGPRTLRRKRLETKVAVAESPLENLNDGYALNKVLEEPVTSGRKAIGDFSTEPFAGHNDEDIINSTSDDDDPYRHAKWGEATCDAISDQSNGAMEMNEDDAYEVDNENSHGEEDLQNVQGGDDSDGNAYNEDGQNNDSDQDEEGSMDEDSESMPSGDYSD